MPRKHDCEAARILAWLENGGFDYIVHEDDGSWAYFEQGWGWRNCDDAEPVVRTLREACVAAMAAPGNNR